MSDTNIDRRIKNLSYSSLLTLHTCPRKFQLYKLGAAQIVDDGPEDKKSSVTFQYGHTVGTGIQDILIGTEQDAVIFKAFLEWELDLFAENPKDKKSFWHAILSLNQFKDLYEYSFLSEYELVYYADAPAVELSFSIECPNSFYYRGSADAILRHKVTGKVLVLETKTTKYSQINPATYKNSAQAIGYSIILDAIFPDLSSYEVLYLVYSSVSQSYTPIPFEKSYYQRALWIRELLLDIDMIGLYEQAEIYPMHGESCYSFFRECEYMTSCTLSTGALTEKLTPDQLEKMELEHNEKWKIKITLADLITSQLAKESNNVNTIRTTESVSNSGNITEDILL